MNDQYNIIMYNRQKNSQRPRIWTLVEGCSTAINGLIMHRIAFIYSYLLLEKYVRLG